MDLDVYGAPDLTFDFGAADRVVSMANAAAGAIEGQTGARASFAATAGQEFRGHYSELFAGNARRAAADGRELVTRFRDVVSFMGMLVDAAKQENARRRRAREWKSRVEARRSNWVDATWDDIFGEEPPPREQPQQPPAFDAASVSQTPRDPLRGGGGGAGTTSARPADLRSFAAGSAALDAQLQSRPGALQGAAADFMASCDFGGIDVGPVLTGFHRWLAANAEDVQWANAVAAAFEAAGAGATIVTVADTALGAALSAAGVSAFRDDLTIDPPQAFGGMPTTGFVNDPVNTSTGNFIEPERDLVFAGASASLVLSRMYNSVDSGAGVFGRGWSSILDIRLSLGDEGAVLVLHDGRQIRFPRRGAGWDRGTGENYWLAAEPAESIGALSAAGGDVLVVRDNRGSWWAFSRSGAWLGTGAGAGTAVLVTRDAEGVVTALSHERGRRIDVEYSDGLVVSARASDGRLVEYLYDQGLLTRVADAVGAREYRWNEQGLIDRVVSAEGVVEAENVYDDAGRVIEQVTAFGRRVRFAYLPGRVTAVSDTDGSNGNTWIADAKGRLVGVVDADGKRQSMSYDACGNLVSVIERDTSVTVHAYDDRGRKVRTVTPEGADISYGYDDRDRVVTVIADDGGVVQYEYARDEDREPSLVVDPVGGRTELLWEDGLLLRITDPTGVTVAMAYDGHGDLVATTNAAGDTARIQRDRSGRVVAAISPSGNTTRYRYDDRGLLTAREDPDGAVWRFEHGPGGRLEAVVDPLRARTTMVYGTHGELVTTTDPLGRSLTRDFDVFGNVATLRLPDGARWMYEHDALSRLRAVTDPAGNVWRQDYDTTGALAAVTDPTGVVEQASIDRGAGIQTVRSAFSSLTTRYDRFGRPTRVEGADGEAEVVAYDAAGRVVEQLDAEGSLTRVDRDPAGRVIAVSTPAGRTTRYEYDLCGRPSAQIDPSGARTLVAYDADSRIIARTLPTGDVARYEHDPVGRLLREQIPGRGEARYSYDKAGRVTAVHDTRYGRRRFRYDAAGQLIEVENGVGGVTRFEHDARGRVVRITDPVGGVITRRYDERDRVVEESDPLGRVTASRYDAAGTVCGVRVDGRPFAEVRRDARTRSVVITDRTRPDGVPVEQRLVYDRSGRLIERARGSEVLRWEYDGDGARTAMTGPGDARTVYEHDPCGRVIALTHTAFGRATIEYDAAGRVVRTAAGDLLQEWRYHDGDLVQHSRTDADGVTVTRVGRDADGRIVRIDDGASVVDYSYDAAGQLVAADSSASGNRRWIYDKGGRLLAESIGGSERTFRYDLAGQVQESSGPSGATTYRYDGAGRRLERVTGPLRTEYGWDGLGRLRTVAHTDDAGSTSTPVWVDALGELAAVGDAGVWWDSAVGLPSPVGVAGEPVAVAPGGLTGMGSGWSAAGWRSVRDADSADPWQVPGVDAVAGAVGFTGAGGLTVAGVEWLGARAYDPASHGFLSVDPLPPVLGAGWSGNPYAYAGNDPVHLLDPSGLRPITDAELRAYAHQQQGALAVAGESVGDWWSHNWEYVVGGLAIAAGVALMFTGVGGPAGLALMAVSGAFMAGGVSAVSQKAQNGMVDWGRVGTDALVGAATGALGAGTGAMVAWKVGTGLGGRVTAAAAGGVVEGGAGGAANYAMSPGPHTLEGYLGATATGASIGGATGGITGYQPKWLSFEKANTFNFRIYRSSYAHEHTILHRAGDAGYRKEYGAFWSRDAPTGIDQVRHDKAILPEWYDENRIVTSVSPISAGYTARFSPGTPMYSGIVHRQVGLDGHVYPGGTAQVHIPQSWNHGVIIKQWPLQ